MKMRSVGIARRIACAAVAVLAIGINVVVANQAGAREASSKQTIVMYYVATLTGGAAAEGVQGCDGEKLAATTINSHGGIPSGPLKGSKITIQCLTDGLSADTAASLTARAGANSSVWTVSGFEASGEALAAAKEAERYAGLTLIASNVAATFLTTTVHNLYTLLPKLPPAGAAAATLCKSYYGVHDVGALNFTYSFVTSYMVGVKSEVAKDHLKLVSVQTWPATTTKTFSEYLTKASSAGVQCLEVADYPPTTCQIAKEARQLGLTFPIIDFTDAFTSTACRTEAGSDYAGIIFGDMYPATMGKTSYTERVLSQFKSKFHVTMSYLGGNAYDSVLALEYAVEDGAKSRAQLGTYLAKVSGPGVGGPISFKDHRIGLRYLTFDQASANGSLQAIAEYKLLVNTFTRVFVDNCMATSSCQKKLGASG